MRFLVALLAILFAVERIYLGLTVEPEHPSFSDLFKTLAHFFVAWLLCSWWYKDNKLHLWLAVMLSVVEVLTAIGSRM